MLSRLVFLYALGKRMSIKLSTNFNGMDQAYSWSNCGLSYSNRTALAPSQTPGSPTIQLNPIQNNHGRKRKTRSNAIGLCNTKAKESWPSKESMPSTCRLELYSMVSREDFVPSNVLIVSKTRLQWDLQSWHLSQQLPHLNQHKHTISSFLTYCVKYCFKSFDWHKAVNTTQKNSSDTLSSCCQYLPTLSKQSRKKKQDCLFIFT